LENGLCLVQGGRLEGRCGIYGANAVQVAWLEVLHSDHDLTEKSLDPADLS